MAREADLSSLSEVELVQAYLDNVQRWETLERVSAKNRLMEAREQIVAELEARDPTLRALRSLLDHADPNIRYSAAHEFKIIAHGAFERTMRELAEQDDEIAVDARSSLEWDAHFQKVGYPGAQGPAQEKARELPAHIRWQAENTPPKPPTIAEIGYLLREALPADVAGRLFGLARPAIGLWPQRVPEGMLPSASRFGGLPVAPPDWTWPLSEGEPLLFLGHVNCAELAGLPAARHLPSSGLLAFFGEHDAVMGCDSAGDCAVFHWSNADTLVSSPPPDELPFVLDACALAYRDLLDMPDPYSCAVADILQENELMLRYADARETISAHGIPEEVADYCSFSKLLGWPTLVQRHDLDHFEHGEKAGDWPLLLQIDDYSNGETSVGWGPGGSLYFIIRQQPLREFRFETCELQIQVT